MTDKKEIKKLVLGIIAAPVFYITLFLALLVAGTAFVKMTEQEDLGDEYVLSYDTNDIWDNRLGREAVGAYIDTWAYDERFILALRLTREKTGLHMGTNKNNPQLWIIDKSMRKIYGPLDLHEYQHMRDSLGVPEGLKMKLEFNMEL